MKGSKSKHLSLIPHSPYPSADVPRFKLPPTAANASTISVSSFSSWVPEGNSPIVEEDISRIFGNSKEITGRKITV
jgi:hypothetical protein